MCSIPPILKDATMSACCNHCPTPARQSPRYRKALWAALGINTMMFCIEIAGSLHSGSVSLLADAVDFAGDAANYAISLLVLGMSLTWRARAAGLKGTCMAGFGVFVLCRTLWAMASGTPPEPMTMSLIALLALVSNGTVALMLYAFREGDSNMRSVWLCSRNDAIGNIAVMIAAAGVFGTGRSWPDLCVALFMAALALSGGWSVLRQARQELASI
jgi:Co/Zn/Cd efflux system component